MKVKFIYKVSFELPEDHPSKVDLDNLFHEYQEHLHDANELFAQYQKAEKISGNLEVKLDFPPKK